MQKEKVTNRLIGFSAALMLFLVGSCNRPNITNSAKSPGTQDASSKAPSDSPTNSPPSENTDSGSRENNVPKVEEPADSSTCEEEAAVIAAKQTEALTTTEQSFQKALAEKGLTMTNLETFPLRQNRTSAFPESSPFPWNDYCKIDPNWDGFSKCPDLSLVSGSWMDVGSVYTFSNNGKSFYFLLGPPLSSCQSFELAVNNQGGVYRLIRNPQRSTLASFSSQCKCTCEPFVCAGAFLGFGVKIFVLGEAQQFLGDQTISYEEKNVSVKYNTPCDCSPPPSTN